MAATALGVHPQLYCFGPGSDGPPPRPRPATPVGQTAQTAPLRDANCRMGCMGRMGCVSAAAAGVGPPLVGSAGPSIGPCCNSHAGVPPRVAAPSFTAPAAPPACTCRSEPACMTPGPWMPPSLWLRSGLHTAAAEAPPAAAADGPPPPLCKPLRLSSGTCVEQMSAFALRSNAWRPGCHAACSARRRGAPRALYGGRGSEHSSCVLWCMQPPCSIYPAGPPRRRRARTADEAAAGR